MAIIEQTQEMVYEFEKGFENQVIMDHCFNLPLLSLLEVYIPKFF